MVSAPGRGSPGSQNQPLRAATRREALPVRRTTPSRRRRPPRPRAPRWRAPARRSPPGSRRSVCSWNQPSRNGVTSLPVMPRRSTSASPSVSVRSCSAASISSDRATGCVSTSPCGEPARHAPASRRRPPRGSPPATAPAGRRHARRTGQLVGAVAQHRDRQRLQPLEGRRGVQDRLHPAHTTVTGAAASAARSADSSQESRAPRCTPPSPPVAKTRSPQAGRRTPWRQPSWRRSGPSRAPARGRGRWSSPRRALGDPHELVVGEPDPDRAVDDGDRGRHRASAPYRVLDLARRSPRSSRWAARG